MYECYLFGERWLELRIALAEGELGVEDCRIYFIHNPAKELYGALLVADDTLPVPLVNIKGSWATVTVEDGAITSLTAALRLMEEGASVQLLPAYQAQAVLPKGRAALRVRLLAQEDGLLTPQICRVTEE